ncbi:MAG: hypothetical protein JW993_12530 [Sedimentisphaerales bacterium]|nr:hypothetical protein [Sedimentisphaerales bacterium]
MHVFQHYILTRFNDGIYGPNSKLTVPPDEWMDHRLRLFTTFTMPSMMEQTCQNFTWLVLMDGRTPDRYNQEIESFRYPNLRLIYPTPTGGRWSQAFKPGDYDLITTRIDNDDAFHRDAIAALQRTYLAEHEKRAKPWVMVFPYGFLMNLVSQDLWGMEYWYNNCPTLVGSGSDGKNVFQWRHHEIPAEVAKCYIDDKPYWLQIVHVHNLQNGIPVEGHPYKILHKDIPISLEWLIQFGVAPDRLPVG